MEQDGCIPLYAPLLYSRLDTFEMNDQLTNVAAPQDASRAADHGETKPSAQDVSPRASLHRCLQC